MNPLKDQLKLSNHQVKYSFQQQVTCINKSDRIVKLRQLKAAQINDLLNIIEVYITFYL